MCPGLPRDFGDILIRGASSPKSHRELAFFQARSHTPATPITSTPQLVGAPLLRSRGVWLGRMCGFPPNPARMFYSGGSCPPLFPKLTTRTRAPLYSGDLAPDMPFGSLRKSSVLAKAWSRKDCVFDMGDSMISQRTHSHTRYRDSYGRWGAPRAPAQASWQCSFPS
jgi:hypothetical protein